MERQEHAATGIEELAELEARLDHFDQLLVDQQGRLLTLEQDFLGEQMTALVVVVRGVPASGAPSALLLTEGDTTVRIALDATQVPAVLVVVCGWVVAVRVGAIVIGLVALPYIDNSRFIKPRHRKVAIITFTTRKNASPICVALNTP